jgi:ketosteroid isomerase-like protein
MSQENVELARASLDAFNRRDFAQITELLHPEVELQEAADLPDARTWRGRGGVMEYLAETQMRWSEVRFDPNEFIDGDKTIVITGTLWGRGKESGVEVSTPLAQVIDVHEGKARRIGFYLDRSQALEAAGLSE